MAAPDPSAGNIDDEIDRVRHKFSYISNQSPTLHSLRSPSFFESKGSLIALRDRFPYVKNLIERCIQLYMNRHETAHSLEVHFGIDPHFTRLAWDKLQEGYPEFFRNYYTRLVLIKQIKRFNKLLEQQHRAMNIPLMPAEPQMSMGLAETAPQADSPGSITNNENEAQSDPNPVGSVVSEEVAGSDPNLVPGGSLAQSPLEGQGMKTNATLDAALTQISQVPNLITVGNHSANFRGHAQPSSSMAGASSHLDSNPEASDHKDLANLASGQGSPLRISE